MFFLLVDSLYYALVCMQSRPALIDRGMEISKLLRLQNPEVTMDKNNFINGFGDFRPAEKIK